MLGHTYIYTHHNLWEPLFYRSRLYQCCFSGHFHSSLSGSQGCMSVCASCNHWIDMFPHLSTKGEQDLLRLKRSPPSWLLRCSEGVGHRRQRSKVGYEDVLGSAASLSEQCISPSHLYFKTCWQISDWNLRRINMSQTVKGQMELMLF